MLSNYVCKEVVPCFLLARKTEFIEHNPEKINVKKERSRDHQEFSC